MSYKRKLWKIEMGSSEYRNIMLGWQTIIPRFKQGLWGEIKYNDKIEIRCKDSVATVRVENVREYPTMKDAVTRDNYLKIIPVSHDFKAAYLYLEFRLRRMDWSQPFVLVEVKVVDS